MPSETAASSGTAASIPVVGTTTAGREAASPPVVAPAGPPPGSASVRIQRRVEFSDTDASGHHHFTAVLRWMEEAEGVLHDRLGLGATTAGLLPRVHINVDYIRRLYHRDLVDIDIAVHSVGRSSLTYGFTVSTGDEAAARGRLVVVLNDPETGRARPWPDDARKLLLTAGPQPPELFSHT